MKRILFLSTPLLLTMLSASFCSKEPIPQTTETYSNMRISEFSYSEIPSAGGEASPVIEYSYTAETTDGRTETRTAGATLTYHCSSLTIDKSSGKISAEVNPKTTARTFNVTVKISKGAASAEKTVTVTQAASAEEIIDSKTMQLPLMLEPHKCVYPTDYYDEINNKWIIDVYKEHEYLTTRTDGKLDRDYTEVMNPGWNPAKIGTDPEYVSVKGLSIGITGGELVTINTYRSGKRDTVVIEEPAFTTSTDYTYLLSWIDGKDEPSQRPKCSYSEGKWNINTVGYGRYLDIIHTITAAAGDRSTAITIGQHSNYPIDKLPDHLVFKDHNLSTQRDIWPNYEDYPVGCSPKWPKMNDIYGNGEPEFFPLTDTKDLHPDGNRQIAFTLNVTFDYMRTRFVYLSGVTEDEHVEEPFNDDLWLRGGITVTATADVPLKDGTMATATHVSEWIQPLETNYYNGRGALSCFSVKLPVIEDAAEDFVWHINFSLNLPPEQTIHFCNLGTESNYFEQDWTFAEITFNDRLYTVKEYREEKKISGLFAGSLSYEYEKGDIIQNTITKNGITINIVD